MNKQALVALLEETKEKQIELILYIVPLRSDVLRPYDTKEYNSFKNEMKAISLQFDVALLDLDDLVPGQYWGSKASTAMGRTTEVDFMHFRVEGHALLADAISAALIRQMGSEPAL